MMKSLHIELKFHCDIEDGEEILFEAITDAIVSNESEFNELMDRVCSKHDMRAELLGGTLQVHEVSLSGEGGIATVEYDYDAYYGCSDMDHGDGVQDDQKFRIEGNKLIFDLELPEIERYDEI